MTPLCLQKAMMFLTKYFCKWFSFSWWWERNCKYCAHTTETHFAISEKPVRSECKNRCEKYKEFCKWKVLSWKEWKATLLRCESSLWGACSALPVARNPGPWASPELLCQQHEWGSLWWVADGGCCWREVDRDERDVPLGEPLALWDA